MATVSSGFVRTGFWRAVIRRSGAILLAAVGTAGERGGASEPVASPVPVASLVSALGSPSRRDREEAEAAVIARGPAVLGELSRLAPLAVGEARLRLERATAILEKQLIERDLEPTSITIAVERVPARDVLARIAAESGNRLELAREVAEADAGGRVVSLAADRETFWEIVVDVLSQASLAIDCDEEGRGVRIVEAAAGGPKAFPAGPFLVVDRGVEIGRGGAGVRPVRVRLALVWEPRLQPLVIRVPMQSVEVEGPAGESIPPASRMAVLEASVLPGSRWVPLVLPLSARVSEEAPLPERLGMVRATVRTWFAAGEHDFEFPIDVPAVPAHPPRAVRVGSAIVSLDAADLRGRELAISAEAIYDEPAEPLASHRSWIAERPLAIVASGGREDATNASAPPVERSVRHRSDRGLGIAATFLLPQDVKAATLRWTLPAALREVPVDIVLRDIPLPSP
jgi:hypothetical protein